MTDDLPIDFDDPHDVAVRLAQGRAITGLALLVLPGTVGGIWLGRSATTPAGRALARVVGIRDLVLGVGALTALRETDHGPEWISMGAVADGIDALVCAITPGVPRRTRLVSIVAGGAAALGLRAARQLADERDAAAVVDALGQPTSPPTA